MAADDELPPRRGGSGSGMGRRIGGAPVWVWAVGAGAILGLVWFARRRSNAAAGSSQAAATDQSGTGDQTPTTIVPQYGGLAEAQYEALLAAIQALHGPASTPHSTQPASFTGPGPVTPPPRTYTRPPLTPPGVPVASGETAINRY